MTNSTQRVLTPHTQNQIHILAATTAPELPIFVADMGGNGFHYLLKRLTDILLAGLVLVVFAPLMLLIGLLILQDSAGSVFFRQKRIGSRRIQRNGRMVWELAPFTMLKFRTMEDGASTELHQQFMQAFIKNDEIAMNALQKTAGAELPPQALENSTERKSQYKIDFDPRITRVGKFLRKTSLDELPQLINVLAGTMTLVGPRPALPYEVAEYHPWHLQRFAAYQGITGHWQVTARSEVNFEKMVDLDIWYAKHQSLFLDLKIILLTPFMVLKGKGAK